MHDALERDERAVGDGSDAGRRARVAVRQLRADGLQRGLHDQLLHIVQRRGVRAPAARHPHVRHQPVLLRRVPVRGGAVRRHRRLEAVRAVHRGAAAGQHRRPVQGEPGEGRRRRRRTHGVEGGGGGEGSDGRIVCASSATRFGINRSSDVVASGPIRIRRNALRARCPCPRVSRANVFVLRY